MGHFIQDIRTGLRALTRSPGFTLVSILTLALGIGASTSIFSLVNGVLLRQLPFPNAHELVGIWHTAPGFGFDLLKQTETTYTAYRELNTSFVGIGLVHERNLNLVGGGDPIRIQGASATSSLFQVLGVPPTHGRSFDEADDDFGSSNVVIISDELWRGRYESDPNILGRTLNLDDTQWEVVGIMPPAFTFPGEHTQLWIPHRIDPATLGTANFNYDVIGRLNPDISLEAAKADLDRALAQLPELIPGEITAEALEDAEMATLLHTLLDDIVGYVRQTLWILLGSVGIILLIACANVANLFLVRAEGRRREVALRSALGAGRRHMVTYFLAESAVVAVLGGILGLSLAHAGIRALIALSPDIPRLNEVGIDGRVLVFSVAVSIASCLFFAVIPATRYRHLNLNSTLKNGGCGSLEGLETHKLRKGLVVSQVALALVLLVGSGLLARSFWLLKNVDPGFTSEGVLTMRLSLPPAKYNDAHTTAGFYGELLENIRGLPGVLSAGAITNFPITDGENNEGLVLEDVPDQPGELPPLARTNLVAPGYFEALGIPIHRGRVFDRHPTEQGVLVNVAFEQHYWPGQSALGKRIARRGGDRDDAYWQTVVGVVGDIRDNGLSYEAPDMVYFPLINRNNDGVTFTSQTLSIVIRTAGPPTALAGPIRQAVWAMDPQLPVASVQAAATIVSNSTRRTTFTMLLLGLAATVALLLGAVGIYGVISYLVSQRTQEIAVRMALGAHRGTVNKLVVRQAMWISLAGITIGLLCAWALTRLMESLLYGVSTTDPLIFFGVSAFVLAVSVLASYVPARRAARMSPVAALRHQ
jgi:putative ABC transport system permease protein